MIKLVPYDPEWPAMFELKARHIRRVFQGLAIKVEHHGETHESRESYSLAKSSFVEAVLARAMQSDGAA